MSSFLTKSDVGWTSDLLFIFIIDFVPFHVFLTFLAFSKKEFLKVNFFTVYIGSEFGFLIPCIFCDTLL